MIADFVAHDLTERNLAFAAAPVAEAVEAGRALLLLDGLDEVRAAMLDTVRDSIAAYAQRYPS